jgi:hypothetical protein
MYLDKSLFVLSALTTIAILLGPRLARSHQAIALGRVKIKLHSIFAAIIATLTLLVIIIIGIQIWHHWPLLPNVTGLIAILLGAIFGSFTARFVPSLFSAQFGRRDPLIGAGVLLLLAIGYSFPLYSDALSDVIGGIGLSSVKTPFLELTLNNERGSKSFTYSASGNPSTPGQVPRPSDPVPGLKWLSLDTTFSVDSATSDDDYISFLNSTLPSDEDYIRFFDPAILNDPAHKQDVDQVKKLLAPATRLSTCLQEYIKVFPDSGLLLVDVKPVIESLFTLHTRANNNLRLPKPELHYSAADAKLLVDAINIVIHQVNDKFQRLGLVKAPLGPGFDFGSGFTSLIGGGFTSLKCRSETPIGAGEIDYRQPYTALVLADLIHARGSPDEAIAVLAEWLDIDTYRSKNAEDAEKISRWWHLRVMSRITLLMAEVAGQSNRAYRDFLDAYKKEMEKYFEKGDIMRGRLPAKCKWPTQNIKKLSREVAIARSRESASDNELLNQLVEEKAYYLLLDVEDESLRTEINFISDEGRIPALENLYDRAAFLASIGKECLPGYFAERQLTGTIADHQVTAGLLELTVADRMATVAASRADHERSAEIAQDGKKTLRAGYPILSSFVEEDRRNIRTADWHERVFAQSEWEKSANLGARAFLRLK